jgi:PAS domain S-box-containing protein
MARARDEDFGEISLRVSEERFRETFENAAVGIAHVGLDGRWLWVNQTLCDIVGYSPDELLKKTFQEITHPGDLEADLASARRLLLGEISSYAREKRYVRKDGSAVWINLTVSLGGKKHEEPNYFIAVIEDISGRKLAEESLNAAQERLGLAQRASKSGVWDWNIAADTLFWTPENYELYGLDPGVVPSFDAWFRAIHPDDRERVAEQVHRVLEQRTCWDAEFRIIHPARGVRWLLGVGDLTCDLESHPVRMVGINIDITERKAAEEELQRREQEFQALVENSPDIITRFDLQSRHLYVNRSVERATGIPQQQFIGRTNGELGMPDDLCRIWDSTISQSIETRREVDFEFQFEGPGGRRHFHSRLCPEFGPDGHVVSVLGVCADITERKVLQAELLTIAEREQRRIGQDLHDDVGQELTGVGLMADALLEALEESGSPEVGLIAKIRARLLYIHGRVQALSRGLIPVEVDARGLMKALDDLSRRVTIVQGIECAFECLHPVPVEDNRVATHLYRITQEAIANAVKHSHAEHLRVTLHESEGILTLEIRDDGIGIPDEISRGSGMGLKIMQYRCGLIGGMLTVGRAGGAGTRVVCKIG